MIIYKIIPLVDKANLTELLKTSVYEQLFTHGSLEQDLSEVGGGGDKSYEEDVEINGGFVLHVSREVVKKSDLHPVDALAYAMQSVRGDRRFANKLIVPGQGFHNSYTAAGEGPTEGIAVVLCRTEDWEIERVKSGLDFEPLPALCDLIDENPVQEFINVGEGRSLVTADSRGLIIDYVQLYDHERLASTNAEAEYPNAEAEYLCDQESSPLIIELAIQHAIRSLDVMTAAKSIDVLVAKDLNEVDHKSSLIDLRSAQMRMTARSIEGSVENRLWHTFIGHDSFRMRVLLRKLSVQADLAVSEQFRSIHPIIEAAEAEIRALRESIDAKRRDEDERDRAKRERRYSTLVQRGTTVFGGAALVGLFASLAGIKGATPFSPYLRAAFATIAIATCIGGVAWLLSFLAQKNPPRSPHMSIVIKSLGSLFVFLVLVLAGLVWLSVLKASSLLLGITIVLGLLGGSLLLYVWLPDKEVTNP